MSESEESDEKTEKQLSTGLLTLPGVINLNKEHTLRRFSPDGEVREPVVRSVRSIMEGLKNDVPGIENV